MSTHKSFLLVAFAPFLWGLQPHLYFLFRWSWSGHDLCVFVCVLRSLPMSRVALGSDAIFCEAVPVGLCSRQPPACEERLVQGRCINNTHNPAGMHLFLRAILWNQRSFRGVLPHGALTRVSIVCKSRYFHWVAESQTRHCQTRPTWRQTDNLYDRALQAQRSWCIWYYTIQQYTYLYFLSRLPRLPLKLPLYHLWITRSPKFLVWASERWTHCQRQ